MDTLLLKKDPGDRSVIMYQTKNDLWDERHNFEMSLSYIDPAIPRAAFKIESVYELAEHFVMWEYAIAMCGYLMKVCPFDQPDVASAKAAVLDILHDGQPEPDFVQDFIDDVHMGQVEVRQAPCFKDCTDVRASLRALLASIQPGDFFALNAFLPFTGEGRREALETIRHGVAEKRRRGVVPGSGPALPAFHGPAAKGRPELRRVPYPVSRRAEGHPADRRRGRKPGFAWRRRRPRATWSRLQARGRRCVHLHLPDNSGVTLCARSA